MPRVVKPVKERAAKETSVRRINKSDGKLADYSSLKAASGIVIPEVKKVLLDRKKTESAIVVRRGLYPSEMSLSDWCPRATYYRMSGLAEPPSRYSFALENVFAQGNSVHDKWQAWLADTGKLWGDWKCSRCAEQVRNSLKPAKDEFGPCVGSNFVDLAVTNAEGYPLAVNYQHDWKYREVTLKSTSLPLSGHADAGLTEHNILVELKSISAGSFRFSAPKLFESHVHDIAGKKVTDVDSMWKEFHSPLTSHLKQGNLYLFMAKEMNMPFDRISFVYENKASNQAKEFIVPYSYSIIEPVIDTAYNVVAALEKSEPPKCYRQEGSCAKCREYEKTSSSN